MVLASKIKICGLSRPEDIAAVNQAKPDYAGFVFAKSRRQVAECNAKRLRRLMDPAIPAVGVFVNEALDRVVALAAAGVVQWIQLHGDEGGDYIARLREQTACPIIKAVRVQSETQILAVQALPCDYLLLDTYGPAQYGGMGTAFDWTMIPPLEKPFFLAGGLNMGNIDRALVQGAYCLDVSSGVETEGYKDPEKIGQIVNKVRS